ncbi:cytochrome c [Cocleimonas flava]|uniref:Cytochrome c556 n=1 Tax=Cocleimonas flava TaxID=634765 RepID=A0A4R1F3G0_9GAMM|nr:MULTISPECIES: cytochrome c [Cocleimonas]MEB8431084.1 cytochrome c [Cocleimonas sp. KMM 6892]MEC4714144.1 cytochrome c [Cocleimonas sp. KMM 6895]MEC4743475.1 cytochrome c [Cocleimonas sp. KMM 6896]TCJ88776.1 cytochrome c556 [Cocleimonas flava]
MKLSRILLTIALTSAVAFTATAHGDKKDKSPEGQAAKYRHNVFGMIGYHFGPMGDMIKGKSDYNKDTFSKNADALASLAVLAQNGFEVEGTVKGSRAKKKIWEEKDKFDAGIKMFADNTAALATQAKSGDMAAIKPAFLKVADDCKQCHKSYRAKKK